MTVLSSENIRKIENRAFESGISYLTMMENAAAAATEAIKEKIEVVGKSVAVVVGGGNNGGDGYGVARLLENEGAFVRVLSLCSPSTETARYERQRFASEVCDFEPSYLYEADIIVDAIFGIGLTRPVTGEYAEAVNAINGSNAYTVSLDIPSGLFADSGEKTLCVKADLTVSFIAHKICRVLHPAAEYFGEAVLSDINLPKHLYEGVETIGEIIPPPVFKKRKANTHKGSYGTLSLVCGSYGMAGAALLCTRAALRCGVGIARIVLPKEIYPAVTGLVSEAVCKPYEVTDDMSVVAKSAVEGASALLIGCGLSTAPYAESLLKEIIKSYDGRLIIDADGLNILSSNIDLIKGSRADIILTPHPGEMARLMGVGVGEIENDRIGYAKALSDKYGCTVILKGSITVVACNGKVYFNTTGNPGMATGGSGDVLAGMVAALCCTGMESGDSAVTAVYIHGAAGDRASSVYGEISALPSDTVEFLPELFNKFGER